MFNVISLAFLLGFSAPGVPITLEQTLASVPPELAAQIPMQTLEAVREGEIPLEEFSRSLGIAAFPWQRPQKFRRSSSLTTGFTTTLRFLLESMRMWWVKRAFLGVALR